MGNVFVHDQLLLLLLFATLLAQTYTNVWTGKNNEKITSYT